MKCFGISVSGLSCLYIIYFYIIAFSLFTSSQLLSVDLNKFKEKKNEMIIEVFSERNKKNYLGNLWDFITSNVKYQLPP